ncbi:MAG: hypothetical protein H6733_05940 [Alphaproteobacteria bacterium]|nr:hypothetical protein [Alphaproteobacteria bacterium]
MSAGLLPDVLALACGAVPAPIAAIADWSCAHARLDAFPAGPILVLDAPRPHRAFVASPAVPDGFAARVAHALRDPAVDTFLAQAPAGTRAMVDTDGTSAVVYLDDLHDVDHDLAGARPADGHELLCATLSTPGHVRTTVTRHGPPPRHLLSSTWQRRVDDLLHAGLTGIWAVAWAEGAVRGVLWINDGRWRGTATRANRWLDARCAEHPDAAWPRIRARAARDGLQAFPDGIELTADGGLDVTVGFFRPPAAS